MVFVFFLFLREEKTGINKTYSLQTYFGHIVVNVLVTLLMYINKERIVLLRYCYISHFISKIGTWMFVILTMVVRGGSRISHRMISNPTNIANSLFLTIFSRNADEIEKSWVCESGGTPEWYPVWIRQWLMRRENSVHGLYSDTFRKYQKITFSWVSIWILHQAR